jgi:tRNA-dihydrouridine synthase 1
MSVCVISIGDEIHCDLFFLARTGCPQRIAHSGHFGSYLLGDEDRELVLDIVRTVSSGIRIPMFVKIRLLNTPEETLTLCRQLVDAGAALIAIHGR